MLKTTELFREFNKNAIPIASLIQENLQEFGIEGCIEQKFQEMSTNLGIQENLQEFQFRRSIYG